MNKMDVLVTRKGQVTIPAKRRKKYGIKEGTRMIVEDSSLGIVFRPIPSLEDLARVDAGKRDAKKTKELLDKGRAEWR
jgi:AbrB family looped-hinge helix DNA binding protein